MSRPTRLRSGPRSKSWRLFLSTAHRGICCEIGTGFTGYEFRKQIEVMGIEEVLSAPRSPWQRAYVERVIGSIRRECLDHVIVFNEDSLRQTLRSYFGYYHGARLHLSLDKDSPDSRSVQSVGKIIAVPQVGGLHHRYERRAA
jgi:putative transposase